MRNYWLFFFALAAGLAVLIVLVLGWDRLLLAWLLAANLVAFGAAAYDKSIAGSGRTRVPEHLMLALALAGGTIGLALAMVLARHKTRKRSFLLNFGLVVLVQAAAIAVYFLFLRP